MQKHLTSGLTSLEDDSTFLVASGIFFSLPSFLPFETELLLSFPGNLSLDVRMLEKN